MLDTMIRLVAVAFEGKRDKDGKPYILHCLHVMNAVGPDDEELMIIGVGHDLFEDTKTTVADLRKEGFSERVINGIIALTHYPIGHPKGRTYDDYIKNIALNEDATKVKRADLCHNSDIMRMKGLRKKDFDRLEKYHRAYEYLKN